MKPVRLFANKIKDNLRTDIIGREVITLERTASAMDIAKEMLKECAVEGTTIFVEEQTRGRGRSEREWFCKKGKGLLFTVVLRPEIQPKKPSGTCSNYRLR
jgi:BirA family biotin operon repressor/biotin-[acetyl-CoA-carboxylase] ligase